ncbi:MAG: FAD-dependent oxidoreductase [Lachnospiraceae bacterium]|nr:FAD-dependent oxidoreductase [Lachnospiraceae bacterium]
MIRIRDIKLPIGHAPGELTERAAKILCLDKIYPGNSYGDLPLTILKKSTDARRKPDIFHIYTVGLTFPEKEEERILDYYRRNSSKPAIKKVLDRINAGPAETYAIPECGGLPLRHRPVVVGMGPSGLFAALLLARSGFRPIVIERGGCVKERSESVKRFWKEGRLDAESNVQFGEGGAGTFSDGKLNTLTRDIRNAWILQTFHEHGAPEEIVYDAKPHIGTDILGTVVSNMREEIISLGGEVMFNTKLTGITEDKGCLKSVTFTDVHTNEQRTADADVCILCIGHSARDTFEMLSGLGINMTQKNFAVGFRVIHPQALVDRWQYGKEHDEIGLPPADYKTAYETASGRRVYSFCMCPGGYVVNASSEDGRLCVNGMSEYRRDSGFANSAIIAAVTPDDFIQDEVPPEHPLAGMYYQRRIEAEAFLRGMGGIPAQLFSDFEMGMKSEAVIYDDAVKGKAVPASLSGILSQEIDDAIIESMHKFGYTREEFDGKALMLGVESRTSSPVRIVRDDGLESNIKGIYPCGEGAGYAGGITSAAADGMKCAEKIIMKYSPEVQRG